MAYKEVTTRVAKPSIGHLILFSHRELKDYAKSLGVTTGAYKHTTAINIWASSRSRMLIQLGD